MYSEIHIPSSSHQSPTFGPALYKFIVMGLVRKSWLYNWRRLWEGYLCDDECNSLLRQGQTPKGRWWWPVYWAASGELPGGPQLNRRLALCVWPSSPPGARRPANLIDGPLLGPNGGRRRPCETLSRGSAAGIVLEDWYWCLLTHSSSWMGL